MMSAERKKYLKFAFKTRRTKLIARELVRLERNFNHELNGITLPCGKRIKLASSISRYEKFRLMMDMGFMEDIPIKSVEHAARMINAYCKLKTKN
jgi:hypothetical protein